MAFVAKYAAQKVFQKQLGGFMDKNKDKDVTKDDPLFAIIDDPMHPGQKLKVGRGIASYIPEHDAEVLAKARKMAYQMDCGLFTLFGVRFGWSSVVGLLPAFGDVADSAIAAMIMLQCFRVETKLGFSTFVQMVFNILIDFVIGLVPLLGDLADAGWKANSKNVRLLETKLVKAYRPNGMTSKDEPAGPASVVVYLDAKGRMPKDRKRRHEHEEKPQQGYGMQYPEPARLPDDHRGKRDVNREGLDTGYYYDRDVEKGHMAQEERRKKKKHGMRWT